MNYSLEKVLCYLAGNENIEAISLPDLQKLADENPYFSVAQLLLAKKLKSDNNSGFLPQAQKTALYFSNPFWLHYQLNESWHDLLPGEDVIVGEIITDNVSSFQTKLPKSKELSDLTSKFSSIELNEASAETEELLKEENKQKQISNIYETPAETLVEIPGENKEIENQPEEEMAAITREPDIKTEQFLSEANDTEVTFTRDNIEQVILETQTSAGLEATKVLEEMAGVTPGRDNATEVFLNEAEAAAGENLREEISSAKQPAGAAENVSFPSDEKTYDNRTTEETSHRKIEEPDEHERMFQNIKAMLDATSEEADADTENAVIPIDPYYTIDYFASQGIKLELEQNPKDQLGQNLKKFTQWLKHMKKLGPEDATEVIARSETEADIQKIADSSNTVREVVTEAMASVLEKQGKKEKAIELYRKLSFLNPDKSAYFAGKINNLKGF